ncbi:MAG: 5-oxoprolinase subunit PxpA [Luteolibacter sp.]
MRSIDLNADLGEGGTEDAALLGLVTSCNIACGGHAGSDEIMRRTVGLAKAAGVSIGAHPGYEDRENFGRLEMNLPLQLVTDLVARQVEKLMGFAGGHLHHVKPHGALYNQANRDDLLAAAAVEGVRKISPTLMLYAPPNGALANAAKAAGLIVKAEGFADRRYREDGSLVPRSEAGAVIFDIDEAVAQAMVLARGGVIETICVHGDGAHAVAMLREIRRALGGLLLERGIEPQIDTDERR